MRRILFRLFLSLLALILFAGLGLVIWSRAPVKAQQNGVDPALTYLNEKAREPAYGSSFHHFDGNSLHYVQAGRGETVLFLHGFPSYWFSFHKQMDAMRHDYRVIAIDGLGTGRSDGPTELASYTVENMSAHIMDLMDAQGAEKFHIVGHDWGSTLGFALAQAHPDRVQSVTGLSSAPLNVFLGRLEADPDIQEQFSYIELFKGASTPAILLTGNHKRVWTNTFEPLVSANYLTDREGQIFRQATGKPKRINALINWYRANIPEASKISDADFWPSRDAKISVPAFMIWGEDDVVYSPRLVEDMKSISSDLQTLLLQDVEHRPHIEREGEVTSVIMTFIAKHSRGQ